MEELNDILQRLEPSLGPPGGEPTALEGGITNRNFKATFGGKDYVIRLHGRDTALLGIDREAELLASEAAARLGIAPAVAAALEGCLVTRFVACRPVASGEIAERVEELARALRAFHDSAVGLPASFRVPALLEEYAGIARERGATLPSAYAGTVAVAGRIAAALAPGPPRPCHNDLLPGNVIAAEEDGRLMIVDWEYAGMGDPRFDLGNMSVNNGFEEADDDRLLAAYHGEPPTDGRRAALKLMRVLSDAREAAWAVVQGVVSELDFDFEGYGRDHFERLLAVAEQPSFGEWLAAA
ncbi:MAG TPA: phosphotransferase [Solirubrobacteraceae bacterium]|nr:phosphotransferase [Solirubrobacteraceae bacterium]